MMVKMFLRSQASTSGEQITFRSLALVHEMEILNSYFWVIDIVKGEGNHLHSNLLHFI